MLYRIITEDKGIPKLRLQLEQIVGKYFDGFTVFEATGYWKGARENSLVFEISVPDKTALYAVVNAADEIKTVNKQEAVLVQKISSNQIFV